ncbi:MAG: replicative DNA helicase [Chloroflexi bacterium]|nr:replicative DNA helicase [Chloroflexota bacterium]
MVNQPIYRASEGILPQSIEAEQAVLGSLLIDPRAVERVASFLRPADFYLPVNGEIYRGMLALYERDMPSDIVTLAEHLQAHDRLDDMGGAAYLASLANMVPTSMNVEYYARIVERLAVLRRLVDAGNRISGIGYDERLEADEALEEAEKVLFEISRLRVTRDFVPLSKVLAEVYEKMDHIHSHESEITGVTTGYIDLDRLTSGFQRSDLIILAARPSMGKCVRSSTLIDCPETGRRLTVEQFVRERRSTIMGLSDTGCVRPTCVSDWIDSGVQPCYRVTTRTGRSVEVTGHHPFLTARGWLPLHDLEPGTKVAVPRAVPVFGRDPSIPEDLARLLAYLLAQGCLVDSNPEFTSTDWDVLADFHAIVARHFPACTVRREEITHVVSPSRSAGGENPLTRWLGDLGLWGKKAEDKAFPDCVWTRPREHLAAFLRCLFSCDGTIGDGAGYPRIEVTLYSQLLARDVQHALTRFGIVSTLWQKTPRCWRLEVAEPDSVAIYQAEIGWIGERAGRFNRQAEGRRATIDDPAPVPWELGTRAARQRGIGVIELARPGGEISPAGRRIDAGVDLQGPRALSPRRYVGHAAARQESARTPLVSRDLYWDEIVSIEPTGDHQVYDLTVPDGANFIAQDICVHNTALAMNIAHAVAVRAGLPVGIFSVEMSAEQLAQRLLAIQAQIDSQKLRTGRMSDADWDRLVQAIGVLSEAPIFVDDTPGLSTVEMRSKARRLHSEQGLGLIVVDYLQLMQGASAENRVQEIGAISRGLKGVARELDVPVLALSQLSRAPEQRPNHEPMLSDLRESGSIEQDADLVMFIYRDVQYNPETERPHVADVIVAKHRNGPTGKVHLFFQESLMKFLDLSIHDDG